MARLPILSSDALDREPLTAQTAPYQPGWLADRQGRSLKYLRLSVTDRCDLRCEYCMPVEGEPASPRGEVLTIEEAVRVARVFHRLGVRTVRLTGGEPLVRKGIDTLVQMLRDEVGIDDIALTTNATALAPLAARMAESGLTRLNVSLDSVRPDTFAKLTRGGELARVIGGIDAARAAGIETIKINAVVIRGQNDDQLVEIVEWAWARDIVPRFIELMPLGAAASLGRDAVVALAEMRRSLAELLDFDGTPETPANRGPASYYFARDGSNRKVGFIGAVTENFCERCNRVRVTAKGDIRACLASPEGLSLRDLFRSGAADDVVVQQIADALFGKGAGHEFYASGSSDRHHDVAMSRVGG